MQYMKKALLIKAPPIIQAFSVILFVAVVFGVYLLNETLLIDYGFFGCMAPAFASAFKLPREIQVQNERNKEACESLTSDNPPFNTEQLLNVASLGICLVFLIFTMSILQAFALLALPFLLLYSGKRGKLKMKYFFYVFYPLHLAALEGISYFLNSLR